MLALEEPENGHSPGRATPARAFAAAAKIAPVGFDLAAERAVEFAPSGRAAADDLVDALDAVAVNPHDLRGAARGHFEREVLDELVELAVGQLTVSD